MCLMEHIDEHPFFVNNFGMASKLIRYIYVPTEQNANAKSAHIGPYGIEYCLSAKDSLPLIGRLNQSLYRGISLVENNMYRAPVFYHSASHNDFLLVRHKTPEGRVQVRVEV